MLTTKLIILIGSYKIAFIDRMKNERRCGETNHINYATATREWKTKCKPGMCPTSTQ